MRSLRLFPFLAFATLSACTSGALPPGPSDDGGSPPGHDGSPPASDAGLSCANISLSVMNWVEGHKACKVDDDCVDLPTACGLDGACLDLVNRDAKSAYLDGLISQWNSMCHPAPCACPANDPQIGCNAGICGPKMFGMGTVGDSCRYGSDCATGECAPSNPDGFPGGYCTIVDCDLKNQRCPIGSACKAVGQRSYCLADCGGFVPNPKECRSGYGCCYGPGPIHPDQPGWCAPSTSGLCTAR